MEKRFISEPPKVILLNVLTKDPRTNTWATARTCYSKDLQTEDSFNASKKERKTEDRDVLVEELYCAGHHTTFEHNIFQFGISGISRHAVWSFLHSHPFYNSDQQSQRFAPINTTTVITPNLPQDQLNIYENTIHLEIDTFEKLQSLLLPKVMEEYFERFPSRKNNPEKYMKDLQKKAQEIARYSLPIALPSQLHHTINEITLLRMARLADNYDLPLEQRLIIEGMRKCLNENGIELGTFVEDSIPLEKTLEYQMISELHKGITTNREYTKEFDESLGKRRSVLEGYYSNAESLLANVVRGVLGIPKSSLNDEEAIDAILNPTKNAYLSEKMNVNAHTKLMRALHEVNYTFRKKLSHTADSQSQRHRTVNGAYPILGLNIGDTPDIIVPELIRAVPESEELFLDNMSTVWKNIQRLQEMGATNEEVSYLLPNAKAIRKWESGDLYGLLHKQIKRLCYAAQEEIWNITRDETDAIKEVHPIIGKYFGAPCDLRYAGGVTPACSEGPRYCGVKVWKLDSKDKRRLI